jgi:hypothetical protein
MCLVHHDLQQYRTRIRGLRYITAAIICFIFLTLIPGAGAQKPVLTRNVGTESFLDQAGPQWEFLTTYPV